MKNNLFVVLLFFYIFAALKKTNSSKTTIPWEETLTEVLKTAKKDNDKTIPEELRNGNKLLKKREKSCMSTLINSNLQPLLYSNKIMITI